MSASRCRVATPASPQYPHGADIKDVSNDESLLHEFFVGSMFTNRLRQFVPNFAYIFGGFKLNIPYSKTGHNDSNEVRICSCDTEQKIDYLIYEKIDGVTMGIALRTCTLEEYLSWMTQLIFALASY